MIETGLRRPGKEISRQNQRAGWGLILESSSRKSSPLGKGKLYIQGKPSLRWSRIDS